MDIQDVGHTKELGGLHVTINVSTYVEVVYERHLEIG